MVITEDAVTRGVSCSRRPRWSGRRRRAVLWSRGRPRRHVEAMAAEAGLPFNALVTAPDLGFDYEKDVV